MMMAACAGLTQPTFRFTCQLSSVSWSFTESTFFSPDGYLLYRCESAEQKQKTACQQHAKVAITLCKWVSSLSCEGNDGAQCLLRHYRCTNSSAQAHFLGEVDRTCASQAFAECTTSQLAQAKTPSFDRWTLHPFANHSTGTTELVASHYTFYHKSCHFALHWYILLNNL